jgi:hypothetical protein
MMNRPAPIVAAPLVAILPPSDQETVPSVVGGPETTTTLAATDFTFQQIHDLTSSETGASTSARAVTATQGFKRDAIVSWEVP